MVTFWSQVNALLREDMTVLDFGAGRGKWTEERNPLRRQLLTLKGRCKKIFGVDIDPAVLENPLVDESVVLEPGKPLPFPDETFDLIVSWAVFEHIADPGHYAPELDRVLKQGGFICAWTPNKWGYVGIGARLTPNRFHEPLLRRVLRSSRGEQDIFPTAYRLNTRRQLRRHFAPTMFEDFSFLFAGPPGYHGGSTLLARFWNLLNWIVPPYFRPYLFVFLRKGRA